MASIHNNSLRNVYGAVTMTHPIHLLNIQGEPKGKPGFHCNNFVYSVSRLS